MSFFELIGFVIMAFVLISPIIKKIKEEGIGDTRDQMNDDEDRVEEKHEREEIVKEFLKSLDMDFEEEKVKPPPPPPPPAPGKRMTRAQARKEKFAFKGKLTDRHQTSSIEERHVNTRVEEGGGNHLVSARFSEMPKNKAYVIKERKAGSTLNGRFLDKAARRDLLLMHEVMSPPRSLRTEQKW